MSSRTLSSSLVILLLASAILFSAPNTYSQVRPVNDYGINGLAQVLRRLQTTGSVLMVGAHPDDEDSALLAYLARGENARTAYLSLTRGEGGQNRPARYTEARRSRSVVQCDPARDASGDGRVSEGRARGRRSG